MTTEVTPPEWLDRDAYPFRVAEFEQPAGRMRYVDEGEGPAVVFVHGTPTWSFLYRRLIRRLAPTHRCIAPDNLGFGLSDKPANAPYTVPFHAENLRRLIDHLGLEKFALVVHDFGGPIGLSQAIETPERITALVVMNTWLWSSADDKTVRLVVRMFGGRVGRALYRRFDFTKKVLIPSVFADKGKYTDVVKRHYQSTTRTPDERNGEWRYVRELAERNDWYQSYWDRRDALAGKPMRLVWGMADKVFPEIYLDRWREAFPEAQVDRLANVGHFVAEEMDDAAIDDVAKFLTEHAAGTGA
ncbi:MAG: alpha/beta fold hydrolase [Deltaproteobacteria bacterium]|nr:alpha/beta fold hydrolase [Deltaproteobacteria bacterium]MCB9487408.1 alpha/beta fold hydrolase [Deltaproteobacteria bacterium]